MAVVIETTVGDITVDLFTTHRPRACLNFLKLCRMKYYNFNLFHTVNSGFIAQTGDPTGSGDGGESIWGVLEGPLKRYFVWEENPRIKHLTSGLISFVGDKNNMLGSQFFITLADDLTYLDSQHCVFGKVSEGFDILQTLNETICDNKHRPYQDIRITHTVVLEDPFPDPENFRMPDASPEATAERLQGGRIAPDEEIDETVGKTMHEVIEMSADREAKARATILEMVGDIPDADMAPPENVLFVCKLNPVTSDDDLEIIFSRFGKIKSCEVIRDKKTGDSLQYAFVEFEDKKACEDAYFKMDNVLIDDRRIHVDFSQSVAKVKWHGKGRGVTHYNENGERTKDDAKNDLGNGKYQDRNSQKSRRRSQERTIEKPSINKYSKSSYERQRDDSKHRNDNRYKNQNSHHHKERRSNYNYNSRERKDYRDDRSKRYRSRSREDDRRNYLKDHRHAKEITRYETSNNHKDKYLDKYRNRKEDERTSKHQKKILKSDTADSSEHERVKKCKKSKKKKQNKKTHSSTSSSESSEPERKVKKKSKKSKKYESSDSDSDSSSESYTPKKKKDGSK